MSTSIKTLASVKPLYIYITSDMTVNPHCGGADDQCGAHKSMSCVQA